MIDKEMAGRAVQWIVTVALIAILVAVIDVGSTLEILASADLGLVAIAVAVALSDRVVMVGKWIPLVRVLLPATEIVPAAKAYYGAMFASLFLPSSVGGDAVRAYAVGRADERVPEVAVSIFVERALGFLALSLVASVSLLTAVGSADVSSQARSILPWMLGVGLAGVTVIVFPVFMGGAVDRQSAGEGFWHKIRRLWRRLLSAYQCYADYRWRLVAVGLASILEQLFPITVIWVLGMALDVPAGLLAVAVATPIAMFVMRLPIAIDGIGVVEGALVYFLSLFGVPAEGALAIAVANRAVKTLVLLPGAFFVSKLRSIEVIRESESWTPTPGESSAVSEGG